MTKKILLLVLLAAFALVATNAMSQSPGGSPSLAPATGSPSPEKTIPSPSAAPGTSTPGSSQPTGTAPTAKDASSTKDASTAKDATPGKTLPPTKDASKEQPTSKIPPTTKETSAKDAKESPSSKSSPTSSTPPRAQSTRATLVVERALVTLIDDNKVPATEPGMLTKVNIKEGHFVQKDELLAEIDTRSTLAKMEIARSEQLGALAQSENEAEIKVAEAAIKVAKAELDQDMEIRRSTPQAVSESQIRKDQFNLDKAKAQLEQAINEKKIAGLTANAKMAQFDAAKIELDLRQIRAPFDGVVVEITKHPGDWVTAGEPIMHIVGLDKVLVKGFVFASGDAGTSPEEVFGKKVDITVDSAGGKKHTVSGTIGFASPVIEGVGTSRQFRIWAEVDNEKTTDSVTKQVLWKLQPGSVGTMTIDLTSRTTTPNSSRADSSKTQTFKPVTGDDKAGSKKSKSREF